MISLVCKARVVEGTLVSTMGLRKARAGVEPSPIMVHELRTDNGLVELRSDNESEIRQLGYSSPVCHESLR